MIVDETTAEQLRIEVAKARGWKLYDPKDYAGALFGTSPEGAFYSAVPCWPNDIAAAWGLVDEMNASGDGLVNLIYAGHRITGTLEWLCEFRMLPNWSIDHDEQNYILGFCETAPIAICRAYLKWKTGGDS